MPPEALLNRLREFGSEQNVFVVVMIAAAMWLTARVWRRLAARRPSFSRCANCGYSTAGLPTWICPECGSDLRIVGIDAAVKQMQIPRSLKVIAWTLLVVVAAPVFTGALLDLGVVPFPGKIVNTLVLQSPGSNAYRLISITVFSTDGYDSGRLSNGMSIELLPTYSGGQAMFVSFNAAGFYQRAGKQEPLYAPPTQEQILDWMSSAGIDCRLPLVQKEADEIFAIERDIDPRISNEWYREHERSVWATGSSKNFKSVTRGGQFMLRIPIWYFGIAIAFWLGALRACVSQLSGAVGLRHRHDPPRQARLSKPSNPHFIAEMCGGLGDNTASSRGVRSRGFRAG
jgi:hypothetical protein